MTAFGHSSVGIMLAKIVMRIAFGVAGIFVGYCFYSDYTQHSRRRDFMLATKLMQRKRIEKIPNLRRRVHLNTYFKEQFKLGEEMLSCGEIEYAIQHFINAVIACEQSEILLANLHMNLSPTIFKILIRQLLDEKPHIHMIEREIE